LRRESSFNNPCALATLWTTNREVIATLSGQREAVAVMNPPWRRKLWLLASFAIAGITVAVVGSSDFNRPSGDTATGPTYARILNGGYPVCNSEDLYERMREAEAVDNDDARLSWTNSLLDHGCTVLPAGTRIRIGSSRRPGDNSTATIRASPSRKLAYTCTVRIARAVPTDCSASQLTAGRRLKT
jgi:hypothetical protein